MESLLAFAMELTHARLATIHANVKKQNKTRVSCGGAPLGLRALAGLLGLLDARVPFGERLRPVREVIERSARRRVRHVEVEFDDRHSVLVG